jgi:hypothetical protein
MRKENGWSNMVHKLFKPSYRTIEMRTVSSMANFSQGAYEQTYKYGSFISGSAVREDANELFDLLNQEVCMGSMPHVLPANWGK